MQEELPHLAEESIVCQMEIFMDFYSHPVCSNENIRLTLQMGLMCSNHKPLPLNTIKGARLPTSGHVELS